MRIGAAFGWAILGGLVIVACGSSSSDGGSTGNVCAPGASSACTGAGGCSGGQVCNASGTAYGDCVCGGGTDSGPTTNDSGSDAQITLVDSGPWTPASLSGLAYWLEASHVGAPDAGGTLTSWPDQSPAAFEPAIAGSPLLVDNVLNGQPVVRFASSNGDSVGGAPETDSALNFGSDNFVLEMAFNPSASQCSSPCGLAEMAEIGAGSCTLALSITGLTAGLYSSCNDANPTLVTVTAGAHVLGFRRISPTAVSLLVDGTPTALGLGAGGTILPSLGIGTFDGDMPEVVVVHNPSDADVTQLEAYLKSKYGL